jgi:histidine triad (HIT) family protein
MTTTDDCLFCKIGRGDIKAAETYRDDRTVAFKDIGPKAPLHELVIPVKHIASLAEATPADVELYGHLMVVAAQRARASGVAANGFRVVMNAGADAGQSVHHVHLHVLAGRPLAWPPG